MTGRAVLILLFALLPAALLAQNQFTLGALQPGQLLLNLSATEQENVEQDTLNISLQYSTQGRDRTELQSEVNLALRKAVDLLEADGRIRFFTTQYQVYTIDAGRPTRTDIENPVWRAQQGIELTNTDSAVVLELTGQLQAQGLVVTSQYYTLSSTRYEEIAGRLTRSVLGKLQQRADAAAAELGKSSADLLEVSLDGSPNFAMRQGDFGMAMAMRAEMATPVAAPGETQVSVTVSARAVLQP